MTGDERLAKVAETLARHREDFTYPDSCLCEDADPGSDSEGHFAAHLAAALAPLLDEFRAEDEARALREAADEIERVERVGLTHWNEIAKDERAWFNSHALRNVDGFQRHRPVVATWLRDRAALAAAEPDAGGDHG